MAKAKNTSKSGVQKDKFGCRKGTECEAIGKQLGRRAVSVDKIVDATKLSRSRVLGHLLFLKKRGMVAKQDDGRFIATL